MNKLRLILASSAMISGCSIPTDVPSGSNEAGVAEGAVLEDAVVEDAASHGVTSSATVFAADLREVGNANEIIVWLKGSDDPPLDAQQLSSAVGLRSLVGVGAMRGSGSRAPDDRIVQMPPGAAQSVEATLKDHGAVVQMVGSRFPVMSLKVPDESLVGGVRALLQHPNVDWIEV